MLLIHFGLFLCGGMPVVFVSVQVSTVKYVEAKGQPTGVAPWALSALVLRHHLLLAWTHWLG